MAISLGALCGLISLVSWGVADYLAKLYATQVGSSRTAFYVRFLSLFPPLLVLAIQACLGQLYSPIDWPVIWKLGPLLGAVLALSYVSYYRGLETGTVSIVASVSSAWFAVAVILAFIFLGEVLSIYQALVIGIIAIGIIMLSGLQSSSRGRPTGFAYGLASMLFMGIATLLYKYLVEAAGPMMSSFVGSLVSVILLWIWLQSSGFTLRLPGRKGLHTLIATGLLDVAGLICMIIGLAQAPIFMVAPLAAAHPIVTMSLAVVFLKERLSILQWVGVILTIAGVIVLSANG
ncbi:DMT family transporter [SAR202 cluster bacterium AC-647-N09_OGT_505m]|nr:DMT family transporter [SAR202 cluster bacterium AC-647-N09_OGT_505m]